MDALYDYHDRLVQQVPDAYFRFLYERIQWNQRMLAIKGPRGAGKTTLMLQHLKHLDSDTKDKALFLSADHHWFYTHTLFETVRTFYMNGGRYLLIDEVHKYPRWSRELKNIYDGFPDMKVVFSASSALDIYRGESDLSRRVITYELPGLSFREYLKFSSKGNFPVISLEELVENHREYTYEVTKKLHPLPHFRDYLTFGYLPLFLSSPSENIPIQLNNIINSVLETDLSFIENYRSGTARKIKRLLGVLAESVPFTPNIASLARKMDASRDSIYSWLTHLQNARILNLLHSSGKGTNTLQKPDKIFLENTNLSYALRTDPDKGSLRETFMLNQLVNANHEVTKPRSGDFHTEDVTIEVGGKNKSGKQVKEQPRYVIAADDIETGYAEKVPLWLFGFLY